MLIQRRAVLAAVSAALLPGAALAQPDATPPPPLPPALDALAPLALRTPAGELTTLGAHLAPGPAVIAFWATWCSPCLAEGRQLSRIRTRVPASELNIVGVNMDRESVRESNRISQFMRRANMNYTQLYGTVAAYRAFNNPGEGAQIILPRLYVFNAEGRPTAAMGRYDGAASLREIDRAVEAVLA